ncbi:hypothetical protein ACGFR6_04435 [Streptomyces sp. NPDC048567]|uniref:hypothetical protein n=1 Tax=Streptomyces sp. NPDC048567 TaxID=3365570 RepID=UPI003719F974
MPPEPAPTPPRRAVSPLDHRLEAATGHDIDSLRAYRELELGDELVPLAQHHADAEIFYVLFDRTATLGPPGAPQFLAVHLKRDKGSYTVDLAALPLAVMAQSWLIHRGCPRDAIGLSPELCALPADETTRWLERRLVDEGDHFAIVSSYTRDDWDDAVTVVALRAMDERAPSPFRVVVEEYDTDAWTYTLREGGFDTADEALQWCDGRIDGGAGPLPPVRPAAAAGRPAGVAKAAFPRPPGRTR